MKALCSWERDSLEGSHDAEAMEQSAFKARKKKRYVEEVDMQTKGEDSVKSNTEELGEGVKCKVKCRVLARSSTNRMKRAGPRTER